MRWNWQLADWPEFAWQPNSLRAAEDQFRLEAGMFGGAALHLASADMEHLTVEALSVEAMTTSEIEGESLDRASVQSSIRQQLGLTADGRRVGAAEQGIAEMMVDVHRSFADPLTDQMLFGWHGMVTNGLRDLMRIGAWRTHEDAMQIVSGALHAPKVHFEAPPSRAVPDEMARFIAWFNRTAPGGADPLPGLERAGIAHLYFVSIHPFEDGNGRIGRAIAEKALAQSIGRPTLMALAAGILLNRSGYYQALERATASNEITGWLVWFAGVALQSQRRAIGMVDFLIGKTRLLDRLKGQLNPRQEKALLRVLREGPDGFKGGLSAGNYAAITGATTATTTRDLADLVAKGALLRTGQRGHTRYWPNLPAKPSNLYSGIRATVEHYGGIDIEMPQREPARDPPTFD